MLNLSNQSHMHGICVRTAILAITILDNVFTLDQLEPACGAVAQKLRLVMNAVRAQIVHTGLAEEWLAALACVEYVLNVLALAFHLFTCRERNIR